MSVPIPFPRYDAAVEVLWVAGFNLPLPAGSLVGISDGNGNLAVQAPGSSVLVVAWTPFALWTKPDGSSFLDAASAYAYLQTVCAERAQNQPLEYAYALSVSSGQTSFPLSPAPTDPNSGVLFVNGVAYRAPAAQVSGAAIAWSGTFPLSPDDDVRVLYS